jgi:hypothetical protein
MNVISHGMLPRELLAGCCTQTVASRELGAAPIEVRMQQIEPGASSASGITAETRVVVAISGSGKLVLDGAPQRFNAPCTLLLPPGAEFRFVNQGAAPLHLVAVLVPRCSCKPATP